MLLSKRIRVQKDSAAVAPAAAAKSVVASSVGLLGSALVGLEAEEHPVMHPHGSQQPLLLVLDGAWLPSSLLQCRKGGHAAIVRPTCFVKASPSLWLTTRVSQLTSCWNRSGHDCRERPQRLRFEGTLVAAQEVPIQLLVVERLAAARQMLAIRDLGSHCVVQQLACHAYLDETEPRQTALRKQPAAQ